MENSKCRECQFEGGEHSFDCSRFQDDESIHYPENLDDDLLSPLDPDDLFNDPDDEWEDDEDEDEDDGLGRGVRPMRK